MGRNMTAKDFTGGALQIKRRGYKGKLLALLVIIALVSVVAPVVMQRTKAAALERNEREAIEAIEKAGGSVSQDFDWTFILGPGSAAL